MSRPESNAQYLPMDRIQTVIMSIDGYHQCKDNLHVGHKQSPMAKNKWLEYRNIYEMRSWNTIKYTTWLDIELYCLVY